MCIQIGLSFPIYNLVACYLVLRLLAGITLVVWLIVLHKIVNNH
jgi:hypothetical protein